MTAWHSWLGRKNPGKIPFFLRQEITEIIKDSKMQIFSRFHYVWELVSLREIKTLINLTFFLQNVINSANFSSFEKGTMCVEKETLKILCKTLLF